MQEFTIKRMGHLGDGITETGLFAPRTLPGELVQANQQGQTLMDRRILTPSSDRVSPPCPHFLKPVVAAKFSMHLTRL